MRFKLFHKEVFGALDGAFSVITDREYYDSQITLTDVESEIVLNYFGKKEIHIGNVRSNPDKAEKSFLVYPSLEEINLNLVFPKPDKTELRLYLSKTKGYKPSGGYIWFIFINRQSNLVIGSMKNEDWNNLEQQDAQDEKYLESIESVFSNTKKVDIDPHGKIKETIIGNKVIYYRDPRLAIMRFRKEGYHCEINPSHTTFIANRTKQPFIEAHHFIPMRFQNHFQHPLDNLNNIMALCPNCHRGIHHAVRDYKEELIKTLYQKRKEIQEYPFEQIMQFYNCLKIEASV